MVDIQALYGFVLGIVLIGMVIGVGIFVLAKFMAVSGLPAEAVTALNNTLLAIADIPNTWLGILVTIVILGIILYVLIRSLGGIIQGARR